MAVAAAQVLRTATPAELVLNGRPVKIWILFIGNCVYTPRGLAPAWRPRLEDGLLDVQYLRADVPFSRTRAVLGSLLGISDRISAYVTSQVASLEVESKSGPLQIAYDGETGETTTRFVFGKGPQLTVYCCRTD
jgi:undecaprenyl-diphosphatase